MKEKYITIQHHGGNDYITVKFHYNAQGKDMTYSKTFNPAEYHSFNECLIAACNHRDLKRAELLTVGLPNGQHKTVEEVLKQMYEVKHESKGNIRSMESHYHCHIKEKYGNRYIDDIKAVDIESNLDGLKYTCSLDTIKRVAGVWRKICKTAIMMNYITINPMDKVEVPKKSKYISETRNQEAREEDILTVLDHFYNAGRNEKEKYNSRLLYYLIQVMAETGMRPAECYALERSDIHLEPATFYNFGYIHVKASLGSNETDTEVIVTTKTNDSRRDIPLTKTGNMVFKELLEYAKTDYVFADYYGNFLNAKNSTHIINGYCKKNGIDFHLYMLRHRFSTTMKVTSFDCYYHTLLF